MPRLSMIDLGSTHGFIYPAMLNGYEPARLAEASPEIVHGIFPTGGAPSVEGARIVACYDDDPRLARAVAEACRVERVCARLEDAFEGVDGVVVGGADASRHRRLATMAIEAGLPAYVDKPFTPTAADAEALVELSERRGVPLFSTSALRYAPQVVALGERLGRSVGEVLTAHSVGTGDYATYGIHSLEPLLAVCGTGVVRVQNLGGLDHDTIQLSYRDGRRVLWQVCRRLGWYFHLAVFGTAGVDAALVPHASRYDLFRATAERIVAFARTRRSPVPLADTLEIMRVIEAGASARGDPRPIDL
jgi:predicted dehydrogenase